LSGFAGREHREGHEQGQSKRERAKKTGATAVVGVFHR